jgi:xanthosine utilization system XapX-like protein
MRIITSTQHQTLCYAAEELKKYVVAMSGGAICPDIIYGSAMIPDPDTVLLATLDVLGLEGGEQYDPFVDDIIDVKINGLSGYIAGSNPRSVLMGV